MSKGTQHVKFKRMNWDAMFYYDLIHKNGFTITEPAEVSLDSTRQKSMFGPQSPLYGTTYEDEQAFIERYRCQCGAFKSRQFEGEICPICGTPVEARDSDINITGWISLGTERVINPYYYQLFQKAIGRNVFPDIIEAKYKITTDGKKVLPKEEDLESKPLSPYSGIGYDKFYEQYENIIAYFKSVKKNKTSTLDLLLKEKRKVFISHIPIASTMLRPQSSTADTFYYNSVDKEINTLFSLSEHLKNAIDVEKDFIKQRIQKRLQGMWNQYFELLNGKEGHIRGEILGGSCNFTSRNVITPNPYLRDNEIDLSYHTFLELGKYKIIAYIMKLEDCNLSKAYSIWKKAFIFDERVYDIMMFIIKHEKTKVLINRNPTLNYYSMLLMNIRQIKKTGEDYSLSVPLSILPGLNADFDKPNCQSKTSLIAGNSLELLVPIW